MTDSPPKDNAPIFINANIRKVASSFGEAVNIHSPLTAAFIGSLVLALLAESFAGAYGSWLAATCMTGYFLFGMRLPPTARNTERFADSLYYLGFILTLFALLLAMTPSLNGGHQPKSTDIIQQFGTAIVTTFIGMSLRIILIQLRPNVSDHEEDTRESIAKYVADLNKEVTATVGEFTKFRTSVTDAMNETLKEFKKGLQDNSTGAGDALNTASIELLNRVKEATVTVQTAVADVADKLSKLDVPTDYISKRIGKAGDVLTADIDSLSSRISTSSTALASALEKNTENLEQIRADTTSLQKLLAKVSLAVTKASEIAERSLADASNKLEETEKATAGIRALSDTAGQLAAQLNSLGAALDHRGQNCGDELRKLADNIHGATEELQADKLAFRDAIAESAKELRKAIDDVADDQ
jgi:methyl-accepting chemotaxis protein